MSSYNRDTKSYESYEMLSKLLNTDKKENIDVVYDTLKRLTESSYQGSLAENEAQYAKARDTLSQNRAKADKYLNYFVTEGGYANSGVATDARIKQELNYESNVSDLNSEQLASKNELERSKEERLAEIESERAKAQAEADSELAESVYKNEQLKLQQKQLEQDNYWKKKQYELDKQSSGSGGASGSNTAYNAVMYNDTMAKFGSCNTADEMQQMYDSLVGANSTAAQGVYGSYYSKLITEMREAIIEKRAEETHDNNVREICTQMTEYGRSPNTIFISLYRQALTDENSPYTKQEVEEAYKRVVEMMK